MQGTLPSLLDHRQKQNTCFFLVFPILLKIAIELITQFSSQDKSKKYILQSIITFQKLTEKYISYSLTSDCINTLSSLSSEDINTNPTHLIPKMQVPPPYEEGSTTHQSMYCTHETKCEFSKKQERLYLKNTVKVHSYNVNRLWVSSI